MKKRKIIGIVSAVIIIIATIVIFTLKSSTPKTITAFFFDYNGMLVEEKIALNIEENEDIFGAILNKMRKPPKDSKLKSVFEKDVRVLSVTKSERDIMVDLSKEFLTGDDAKDSLCVYAVVLTLCDLKEIDKVLVTVEGEKILLKNGGEIGLMSEKDINLGKKDEKKPTKTLTLYFGNKESSALVSESRIVEITDTAITEEQLIVRELIKGPKNANAKGLIVSDTKEELLSAETKDGTCFVNFKSGFISKNTGSAESEKLIIFSIVNSLCESEHINSVQFLIDGQKAEKFGNINISEPLISNQIICE